MPLDAELQHADKLVVLFENDGIRESGTVLPILNAKS